MALTAWPVVVIDEQEASEAQASGAGPATAVTGSKARNTTTASRKIGLFEASAPDLSGVAVDGRHALWTASGSRQFFRITNKKDTAQSLTCNTVINQARVTNISSTVGMDAGDLVRITGGQGGGVDKFTTIAAVVNATQIDVTDAPNVTLSGTGLLRPKWVEVEESLSITVDRLWAIGGKRKTLTNASSARLFTDAKSGWKIEIWGRGNPYAGPVSISAAGSSATDGGIWVDGVDKTDTGARVEIVATGATPTFNLTTTAALLKFTNLKFVHTTTAGFPAFRVSAGSASLGGFLFYDCEFRSAGVSSHGFHWDSGMTQPRLTMISCVFRSCGGHGVRVDHASLGPQFSHMIFYDCWVNANGSAGMFLQRCKNLKVFNCLVNDNPGSISIDGDGSGSCEGFFVVNCTLDGNGKTGDGIKIENNAATNMAGAVIANNIIVRHVGWAVNATAAVPADSFHVGNNCLPSSVSWKNSSGNYRNLPGAGTEDVTSDPQFIDAAGNDYQATSTGIVNKGYPTAFIGGTSKTRSFVDIGVSQLPAVIPILDFKRKVR